MLSNGMGGLDWNSLGFAVALHGVADVAALIDDLIVIKTHSKPEDDDKDE